VELVDMGGHGYGIVRASGSRIDVEFVCVPRPINITTAADGGPLRYRVRFGAPLWHKGQVPRIERSGMEGDLELSG
jgi:alkaline phosphatase D